MSEEQGLRLRDVKPQVDDVTPQVDDVNPHVDDTIETILNGGIQNEANCNTDINTKEENITYKDKFRKLKKIGDSCCSPCLTSHNPLPEDANIFQKVRHAFMLPPHGILATYLQIAILYIEIWMFAYTLIHKEALPGANIFSLLTLFFCCSIGGYLISLINLPPLLGFMFAGMVVRNTPGLKTIGENIDPEWSMALRKIALNIILTRAGLFLDPVKLRQLPWPTIRVGFIPCAAEIATEAVVARFLFGFPWLWCIMLGCIMGSLSPAVTIPAMFNLHLRRYGVAKGIPTMILFSGGIDSMFCLTVFSVVLGIVFSTGDFVVTIVMGPIGVLIGVTYGCLTGIFLWYFPANDCVNKIFFRYMLLLFTGLIAIFGSAEVGIVGAGPIGCLITAVVAAYKWRLERKPGEPDEVLAAMGQTGLVMQHYLLGLIGAALDMSTVPAKTAGLGVATLAAGLAVRSIVTFLITLGFGLNAKERLFVTLAWLSKATVQAAIGGSALDTVHKLGNTDPEINRYATDLLTLAVITIVICCPIGAACQAYLGPILLKKAPLINANTTVYTGEQHEAAVHVEMGHVVTDTEDKKVTSEKSPEVSPTEIRGIDSKNSQKDLSRTLNNRASKQLDNELVNVNHVTQNVILVSVKNRGIDNPTFTKMDDERCVVVENVANPRHLERNYRETSTEQRNSSR